MILPPSDLKVFAIHADSGGCGFYRILEPSRVARENGYDVVNDSELPGRMLITPQEVIIEAIDTDADVIVFQRPLLKAFTAAIRFAQSKGIACVVELDDNLSEVHRDNFAAAHLDPRIDPNSNFKHVEEACSIADLVTVSTPSLAKHYARHGRYRVLRNRLPEHYFGPVVDRSLRDPRVGWTGTLMVHPEDLDVAGSQLTAALDRSPDKNFYVVGDGQGVPAKLSIPADRVQPTGWVELGDYIETVNQTIDVGVVPLRIDTFNQGKSWLKQLEFASQGIPSVVSPTDEHLLLAQKTGNLVARKPRDWQKLIKRFTNDRDYYLECSETVRSSVRDLTYENHVELWLEAWSAAVLHRKSTNGTMGV